MSDMGIRDYGLPGGIIKGIKNAILFEIEGESAGDEVVRQQKMQEAATIMDNIRHYCDANGIHPYVAVLAKRDLKQEHQRQSIVATMSEDIAEMPMP